MTSANKESVPFNQLEKKLPASASNGRPTDIAQCSHEYSLKEAFEKLKHQQLEKIKPIYPLSTNKIYKNQLDEFLNREYGFQKSFETGDSIDLDGNPIPWMTYSALYFLDQLDLSECDIFEWGSGNSSLYFCERANSVRSIESNAEWYEHVEKLAPSNLTLSLESPETYAQCIKEESGDFSVVVVDGDIFRRLECALAAIEKIRPGGLLILDNSDWLQNTCNALTQLGFEQIDFGGPGPINQYTWCTSIFFKTKIQIPGIKSRPSYLKAGLQNVRDIPVEIPMDAEFEDCSFENPPDPVPVNTVQKDSSVDLSINHSKDEQRETKVASFESEYANLKANVLPPHADIFCSQEGEDVLIKRLLKLHYHQPGFYVDIGAYDPVRFSNTYHYYLQGWHGINIDPSPGVKQKFNRCRPRDTTLELGIAEQSSQLAYYQFQEPAFNTFDPEVAERAKERTQLIETVPVRVVRLDQVLDLHLVKRQPITFMSIDVEGYELSVLNSSDWRRYRPYIVCIEALGDDELNEITSFMSNVSYVKAASTKNSHIYCEAKFWNAVE